MRLYGSVVLAVFLACGGSDRKAAEPVVSTGGGDAPDKDAMCAQALDAHYARHDAAWEEIAARGAPETLDDMADAACHLYCGRATECAIQEACATLDEAKIADLQLERTGRENTRQCLEKCGGWRMTREQIQTLGNCSQEDADCATFRKCTNAAQL